MKKDMHLFGVYALARAAGIKDHTAWEIAFSSQFVDDSLEDTEVVVSDDYAVLPTMTSHKPLDFSNGNRGDQWKVWLPFHFLPGNEPEDGCFTERMVCRKNSKVARKMLDDTLDKSNRALWPHLVGITAHVYADTFSHHGFIGISSDHNKVENRSVKTKNIEDKSVQQACLEKIEKCSGLFAELVPVGHGPVGGYPDIPFLNWEFYYESDLVSSGKVERDNLADYMDGAAGLHEFFVRYAAADPGAADPKSRKEWKDIAAQVEDVLTIQHHSQTRRSRAWREAIREGKLFKPTQVDKNINYDSYLWSLDRLKRCKAGRDQAKESNACHFHRAAHYHRTQTILKLLPEFDIVVL